MLIVNHTDLLADYFELPRDYESGFVYSPLISQFIGDFNFYVGLDRICRWALFLDPFSGCDTANGIFNLVRMYMGSGDGFSSCRLF